MNHKEKNEILDNIEYNIKSTLSEESIFIDETYHHNTDYKDLISILEYGILTLEDQVKLKIRYFDEEQMRRFSVIDSHINGIDGISLSKQGLDDLYYNEDEYISSCPCLVDIIVNEKLKAWRSTYHYGNEFVHTNSIGIKDIRCINFRLIKYISDYRIQKYNNHEHVFEKIVFSYNQLIDASSFAFKKNLEIPFKEVSTDEKIINKHEFQKLKKFEIL